MRNPQETRPGLSGKIRKGGITAGKLLFAGTSVLGLVRGAEAVNASVQGTSQVAIGDVSCDGQTNSIDAALVLQKTAGLIGSLACEEAGDVNGDDISNAVDAALILQYGAGLIDHFPDEKEPTATATRTLEPTLTYTPTSSPSETPTLTPEPTQTFQEGPNYELAQGITELINQKRQELGINQLTLDPAIVSAANEYAKFLFDNIIINNVFPALDHNLDGLDPTQRAEKYGYQGGWVGEVLEEVANTDIGYFTPEHFMQWWINSPAHYSNIIDPKYRYIGVGCYQGSIQLPNVKGFVSFCVGNFGRSS